MKKMTKFVTLLAVAVLCAFMPAANTLSVSAEEPTTYYLKYVPEKGEWRYFLGQWYDNNEGHRELYYLHENIKDGDYVVIEGKGSLNLTINVTLGNLTFVQAENAVVTAKGIQELYVLKNSTVAVNGDVTNAYVYDNAVCNLNNNVQHLTFCKDTMSNMSVKAEGTVAHLTIMDNEKSIDLYDCPAGSVWIKDGYLQMDMSQYSQTPPAATPTPDASAPAGQTPSDADEYDDVPKTGDSFFPFYLLGMAALCLTGGYLLRKKETKNTI